MKKEFTYEYEIGESVYHATPDGDKGVVLDVNFKMRGNIITYLVTFGRNSGDEVWCLPEELSDTKLF